MNLKKTFDFTLETITYNKVDKQKKILIIICKKIYKLYFSAILIFIFIDTEQIINNSDNIMLIIVII